MSPSALDVSKASSENGPSGFHTWALSAFFTDSATSRRVASCTVFGDFDRPDIAAKPVLVANARTQGSAAVAWLQHSSSPDTNRSGTLKVPARAAFRCVSFQERPFTRMSANQLVKV